MSVVTSARRPLTVYHPPFYHLSFLETVDICRIREIRSLMLKDRQDYCQQQG